MMSKIRGLAILAVVLWVAWCPWAGADSDCLPDESGVPIMTTPDGVRFVRTPDERFENLPEYPFKAHYAEVSGLRMAFVDEGPRDGEIILLMHGQPTWSYLYRKMIPPLVKAGHRVIALDLMGMGRSDKPIDLNVYSYAQHIEWVHEFVVSQDLQNVTLFCQDWGSLIGLRVAGDLPERFARIVVANGTLPVSPTGRTPYTRNPDPKVNCSLGDFPPPGMMEAPNQTARFQIWLDYCLDAPMLHPHQVVEYLTESELTPGEAAAYDAPFPSYIYTSAIRTFPSLASSIPLENIAAWDRLGHYDKPFLTLMGEKDRNLGSKANQDKLTGHVPGAAGQPHERFDANHFIQEDIGETLADRVNKFMAANPIR